MQQSRPCGFKLWNCHKGFAVLHNLQVFLLRTLVSQKGQTRGLWDLSSCRSTAGRDMPACCVKAARAGYPVTLDQLAPVKIASHCDFDTLASGLPTAQNLSLWRRLVRNKLCTTKTLPCGLKSGQCYCCPVTPRSWSAPVTAAIDEKCASPRPPFRLLPGTHSNSNTLWEACYT